MAETSPQPAAGVRVVGVGHIALDHHFTVDGAPALGRKTAARSYKCLVGGMTANALVAAARLGAQAELLSPVGDDEAVHDFCAHLQREGVGSPACTACRARKAACLPSLSTPRANA